MRATCLAALLIFAGCRGDDTDSDTGSDTGFLNTWAGTDNGSEVPFRAPDQTFMGSLVEGTELTTDDDLAWANSGSLACWTTLENPYFFGKHVWHDFDQGDGRDIYLRMVPNDGTDLSLYGAQRSVGGSSVPPDLLLSGTGECSYIRGTRPNPGQPEVLCMPGFPGYAYSLLIGVAGAHGEVDASYQLQIWDEPPTGCLHPSR
ncbi:MAG: hypothetical protein JRI25_13815 [Deltaproteobacteria bacterium]|nr:hypothetical protein [Deltaproteobacteria bacterium]